jgi:hypothetical protein
MGPELICSADVVAGLMAGREAEPETATGHSFKRARFINRSQCSARRCRPGATSFVNENARTRKVPIVSAAWCRMGSQNEVNSADVEVDVVESQLSSGQGLSQSGSRPFRPSRVAARAVVPRRARLCRPGHDAERRWAEQSSV